MSAEAPDGFEPSARMGPFFDLIGPIFTKTDDRGIRLGLRARAEHCNARGFVHAAILAALLDVVCGRNCVARAPARPNLLTVSLTVDYVAAAQDGDWLEASAAVTRARTPAGVRRRAGGSRRSARGQGQRRVRRDVACVRRPLSSREWPSWTIARVAQYGTATYLPAVRMYRGFERPERAGSWWRRGRCDRGELGRMALRGGRAGGGGRARGRLLSGCGQARGASRARRARPACDGAAGRPPRRGGPRRARGQRRHARGPGHRPATHHRGHTFDGHQPA